MAEPKTIWVRLHKKSRLVLRYAPGSYEDGKVKPPNVLIGVVSGDTKAYFALSTEEVFRLAETLRYIGMQMVREETELQQRYEAKRRERREEGVIY